MKSLDLRKIEQITCLQKAYNYPLNDTNVKNMSHKDWRHLVKSTLVRHVVVELKKGSASNKKTKNLDFVLLKPAAYLFDLHPQFSHVIFKVCTRMFNIKVNFKIKCKQDHFLSILPNKNAMKIFSMFALVKMDQDMKDH